MPTPYMLGICANYRLSPGHIYILSLSPHEHLFLSQQREQEA